MSGLGEKSKKNHLILQNEDLVLRSVRLSDVGEKYVRWMNDPEVNRYMETRFRPQTRESIESYVRKMTEAHDVYFLAMVMKDAGKHIGNIKLQIVSRNHRRGEISLWIGERGEWGKGLATQAISLVTRFAVSELGLHKLTAGCYSNNTGSARAFEKAGFTLEAVLKEEYLCEGTWVDRYCYAFIAPYERI